MKIYFASTYGSGAYDTSTYNGEDATSTGTTSGASTNSGGLLADTGIATLFFVSLACLIIFTALIVRFWRRPAKQIAEAEQPAPGSYGSGNF